MYYYAWRGGPRLLEPYGTAAFTKEFLAALESRNAPDPRRMRGLITSYKSDPIWLEDTSASTRKLWAPWLDRISEAFGAFKVTAFRRDDMVIAITKWRDTYRATPRAADTAIQVLSRLMTYGRVSPNPCSGIKKLYKGDRADVVWSDAELERLAEYGSPELIQAVRLAILTGMRQADLCTLKWSDVKAFEIVKRSAKSRNGKEYATPLYGELRIHLETLRSAVDPKVKQLHATVLTTKNGLPWKPAYLSESFGEAAKRAGIDKHFHDLRGTTATKLYLLNFTLREIAEMLAWEEDRVDRIIKRYVTRDAMVRDRIRRLDGSVQVP